MMRAIELNKWKVPTDERGMNMTKRVKEILQVDL
jgi:hypothetical protein